MWRPPSVELTPHQSGGFQGRRNDRAGRNARGRAGWRSGNLRNRKACGLEGRRDHGVGVERVTRLSLFTLRKRGFGRTMRVLGGCSSDNQGAAASGNFNHCRHWRRGTRHFNCRIRQSPEACDVMRRGDSHIQEKCAGRAAALFRRRRERHAMRHAADGKRLDQHLTVCIAPYAARVVLDEFLMRGTLRKPVHIGPLPNDVFSIGRFYDRIAGTVPYRDFWPWSAMSGCCSHAIAKRLRSISLLAEHSLERLLYVARTPIGQSGDDGAASKNLRICCEHNRSHGAARREASHEDFAAVGGKCRNGVLDHLPDRKRLAMAARDVVQQKPRKTILRIVRRLLLRIDDREAEAIGKRRPTGSVVILYGSLGAAMEHDNQWRHGRQVFGSVGEHAKVAGIYTKTGQFAAVSGGGRAP